MAMAEMFNNELREMQLEPATLEMAAAATFGSASAATEWWLGSDPDSPRRMPSERFVAHLTTIMLGTIQGDRRPARIRPRPRPAGRGARSPRNARWADYRDTHEHNRLCWLGLSHTRGSVWVSTEFPGDHVFSAAMGFSGE